MYVRSLFDRLRFRDSFGHLLAYVCVLSVTAMASPVFAQAEKNEDGREYAKSSDKEQELNDRAVSAIIKKDYPRAIALLEESLELGESNIVYLNLGRAYQKIGNCEKARAAYQKVFDAPIVRDPSPQFIDQKAEKYLAELDEECPAEKEAPASDGKGDDDGEPTAADTDETSDTQASQQKLDEPPEPEETGGWKTGVGWAAVGTGVALIGGGVGLHFVAESKRDAIGGDNGETASVTYAEAQDIEQRANTFDTVGLSMGIAGGVIGGFGAYLIASGGSTEKETTRVSIHPQNGGASVVLGVRW